MGWFEEQIQIRKANDREAFEGSCLKIADSVMGKKMSKALHDERSQARDAIGAILKYYHVKPREVPEKFQTTEDVLEFLLRPYGIMTREVKLTEGWRKDASGAMLTTMAEDGRLVAIIPIGIASYMYFDPRTKKMALVTKKNEKLFSGEAYVFYKPFPTRALTMKDLLRYIFSDIEVSTFYHYLDAAIALMVTGIFIPLICRFLFMRIAVRKDMGSLMVISVFLICTTISCILIWIVQELYLKRMVLKLNLNVESATMMRILTLPSEFFKKYSAGDIANRVQNIKQLVSYLINLSFSGFVTALFSFFYIIQIYIFAPSLANPAFVVAALQLAVIMITVAVRTRVNKKQKELAAQESGLAHSLITGIEKIKLSGAEKRAFAKWGNAYAAQSASVYNPPLYIRIAPAFITGISVLGTVVIYSTAIKNGVNVADFYAFMVAFAMISGALTALVPVIEPAAQIKPILELARPILEATPEVAEDKTVIEKLTGNIELNNVSFRYRDDMPLVLDDVSLKIRAGQYVAITGKTGSGKTTLMRILLGFEKPQTGAVYYDGWDLNTIDPKSLRSKIGAVMQNGTLFSGDIYSNIVASDPKLTLDDAWDAAELAGIADDIRQMPMNMYTVIQEGNGGISGGQRQRLMIARAIAPKPKILLFDEATSALDSIAQKQVSQALDQLKCTRIVIAHRLSTIRNCDRILVLDGGKIVEDGTYEELIMKRGVFTRLVARQRVERGKQ